MCGSFDVSFVRCCFSFPAHESIGVEIYPIRGSDLELCVCVAPVPYCFEYSVVSSVELCGHCVEDRLV